jgi:hypothetical protein
MAYQRTIICLANSRKPPSGRCIAGREFNAGRFGHWIRPISDRPTEEISEEERRYQDGTDPDVLDIIAIEMAMARPHQHQQENHVIDDNYYWVKVGTLPWSQLEDAVDYAGGPLWLNGYSSSLGINDRVPEHTLHQQRNSLVLARPRDLMINVDWEGPDVGSKRLRVRADFSLNGHHYRVVVTDPPTEHVYLRKGAGEYAVENAYLCLSLADPWHGFAYKLVAAVITPERARRL